MRKKLMNMILVFVACGIYTNVSFGNVVRYEELIKPGGPGLAYGETIRIIGNVSDFKIKGESIDKWVTLNQITTKYKIDTGKEKEVLGKVDSETGDWEIVLEPLPLSSLISLTFKIDGRLSDAGAQLLVLNVLIDKKFDEMVAKFFNETKGKPAILDEPLIAFLQEVKQIAENKKPVYFQQKITPSAKTVILSAEEKTSIRSIVNMKEKVRDIADEVNDSNIIQSTMAPHEVFEFLKLMDSEEVPISVQEIQSKYKNYLKQKTNLSKYVDTFVKNYLIATSAIIAQVSQEITAEFSMSSEMIASSTTQDIQKYAGVDVGAVYAPRLNEFRKFFIVSIYYGAVDDKPLEGKGVWEYCRNRFSFSIGWDAGDLSNNTKSDIDGTSAYVAEIGYRLNKYFRIGAGRIFYRSKADGDIKRDTAYSLSVDLMGFKALQGLVAKQ